MKDSLGQTYLVASAVRHPEYAIWDAVFSVFGFGMTVVPLLMATAPIWVPALQAAAGGVAKAITGR